MKVSSAPGDGGQTLFETFLIKLFVVILCYLVAKLPTLQRFLLLFCLPRKDSDRSPPHSAVESNILEGFSISQKLNITAGRLINFSASLEGERTFEYRIARLRRHPSRYKTNRSQTLHAFSPPFVTFLSRFCHAFCHVYCHAFLSRFFVTHFPPSQKYFTFGIGLRTGSVHSGLLNTKKKR